MGRDGRRGDLEDRSADLPRAEQPGADRLGAGRDPAAGRRLRPARRPDPGGAGRRRLGADPAVAGRRRPAGDPGPGSGPRPTGAALAGRPAGVPGRGAHRLVGLAVPGGRGEPRPAQRAGPARRADPAAVPRRPGVLRPRPDLPDPRHRRGPLGRDRATHPHRHRDALGRRVRPARRPAGHPADRPRAPRGRRPALAVCAHRPRRRDRVPAVAGPPRPPRRAGAGPPGHRRARRHHRRGQPAHRTVRLRVRQRGRAPAAGRGGRWRGGRPRPGALPRPGRHRGRAQTAGRAAGDLADQPAHGRRAAHRVQPGQRARAGHRTPPRRRRRAGTAVGRCGPDAGAHARPPAPTTTTRSPPSPTRC